MIAPFYWMNSRRVFYNKSDYINEIYLRLIKNIFSLQMSKVFDIELREVYNNVKSI